MPIAKPNDPTIVIESNCIHVYFDDRFLFIDEPKWMQMVLDKITEMRQIPFNSPKSMIIAVSVEMIVIQNLALNADEFVPKLCFQTTTQSHNV